MVCASKSLAEKTQVLQIPPNRNAEGWREWSKSSVGLRFPLHGLPAEFLWVFCKGWQFCWWLSLGWWKTWPELKGFFNVISNDWGSKGHGLKQPGGMGTELGMDGWLLGMSDIDGFDRRCCFPVPFGDETKLLEDRSRIYMVCDPWVHFRRFFLQ